MPVVTVGTAQVAYSHAGSGPPLVLVHGVGGSGQLTFGGLLDQLTPSATVIIPELSGTAATSDDGRDLTIGDLADQVVGVIEDSTEEPCLLLGYSMGALVALEVAARAPGRVRALGALCGWVRSDTQLRLQFDVWRRVFATDPELFVASAFSQGYSPGFLDASSEQELADGMAYFTQSISPGTDRQSALCAQADVEHRLAALRLPNLVAGAVHDAMVPLRHSHALAEALDRSVLVELDSGHLVPWERPDLVVDVARRLQALAAESR